MESGINWENGRKNLSYLSLITHEPAGLRCRLRRTEAGKSWARSPFTTPNIDSPIMKMVYTMISTK